VIGNQRQLEMKLNRQLGEIEKYQSSARQALVLADQARAQGDARKAQQYEQSAQAFATQLITAEQSVEDLKTLHDQSLGPPSRPSGPSSRTRPGSSKRSPSGPSCSASWSRPRCRSRPPSRSSR